MELNTFDILIMEDEPAVQALLSKVLQKAGFITKAVDSGESGLAVMQVSLPRLVLLDLMMPGMGGIAALEQIRKGPTTAALPVVILTSKGQIETVRQAIKLGVDDYIIKPFIANDLVSRVASLIYFIRSGQIPQLIRTLQVKDPALSRQIDKLGIHAVEVDAYPCSHDKVHICVTVPTGTNINDLRGLEPAALESHICVLVQSSQGWRKVWPIVKNAAAPATHQQKDWDIGELEKLLGGIKTA